MNQSRLVHFDLLKVFAIFLVIWGHCIQFFLSSYECNDLIYLFIYSFHMPLFMMISGFFSWNSYNLLSHQFLWKKFRELILPVLSWGGIYETIQIAINLMEGEKTYLFYDFKAIYIQNLWFLKCLFLCYVLAYCCFKQGRTNYVILFSTTILSQFVTNHNICTMYPAFLCGIFLRKHNRYINNYYLLVGSFFIFVLLLHFWDASFWPIPDMLYGICHNDFSTIQEYIYKGGGRILIGIIGSFFFISLFSLVFGNSRNRCICILSNLGKYTLGVYIFQSFIIEYTLSKFINFDNSNYWLFQFLYIPVFSIAFILLTTYIVKQSYNHNMISFFIWGRK